MITRRHVLTAVLSAVMLAAAIAMIAGAFNRSSPAEYRLALGVGLFASCGLLLARSGATERVLEIVRQNGYDAGYSDGCEIRRDRVVRLAGGGPVLPLDGAAQQLGEDRDLGSSA